MALTKEIKAPSELEADRLVCPLGHHSWERTNGHFSCPQCKNWGADPAFARLRDKKTGEIVPRDAVEFYGE